MPTVWIVEPLGVIEHISFTMVPGRVDLFTHSFSFQAREAALHRRVVPDVARPAHATRTAMVGKQALELLAGVRATLVRMVHQLLRSATTPDRQEQWARGRRARSRRTSWIGTLKPPARTSVGSATSRISGPVAASEARADLDKLLVVLLRAVAPWPLQPLVEPASRVI